MYLHPGEKYPYQGLFISVMSLGVRQRYMMASVSRMILDLLETIPS
jgi:hypothetical protein